MSRWTPVGLPYPLWGKSRGFIWHSCQFIMVRIGTTKDSPSKCRLDHTQVKSSPFRGCMDQSGSYQRPTQTQCSSDSMIAQELIVPSWWPDVRFSILPSTMSTLGKIKDFTSVASVTITASLVVAGSTYVYVAFVFFSFPRFRLHRYLERETVCRVFGRPEIYLLVHWVFHWHHNTKL